VSRPGDVADQVATINSQPLEVYMYYAALEREREDNDHRPVPDGPWTAMIKTVTGRRDKIHSANTPNLDVPMDARVSDSPTTDAERDPSPSRTVGEKARKASEGGTLVGTGPASDNTESMERSLAYRAMRTASWQAVFYLM
jgi:hypothetical protein